jgi:23S rRNA pseudouridine1911/1915/1917 synthase
MDKSTTSITYTVSPVEAGLRLDEFVHKQEGLLPVAAIRRAIEEGDILVNERSRSAGWRLKTGDKVRADLEEHRHRALEAENIPLEILFEDEYIVLVNKPPSMLSHPSKKERAGTLINALIYHFNKKAEPGGSVPWPALVHRLDRDTSGVILATKQDRALQKLSKQFNERRVKKIYQAIVFGLPAPDEGIIEAPIGHHPALWPRWRVMEKEGKPAQTRYFVKEQVGEFSLVELEPLTGRTHQLRIHLAHINHPIAGDHTYGRAQNKEWDLSHPDQKIKRQFLHAAALTFRHPFTNQMLEMRAPLPKDMEEFLRIKRNIHKEAQKEG